MRAKIKGTTEWKDYKPFFQDGNFVGLETLGYTQTHEEWCKEHGIEYYPDSPFKSDHYVSAILPLEAFDLPNELDWQSFRAEAAKDILCAMIQGGYDYSRTKSQSELAIKYVDELIKQLKEKED